MKRQWETVDEPSKEIQALLLLERGTLTFPTRWYSFDIKDWPEGLIVRGISGTWYRWNA